MTPDRPTRVFPKERGAHDADAPPGRWVTVFGVVVVVLVVMLFVVLHLTGAVGPGAH